MTTVKVETTITIEKLTCGECGMSFWLDKDYVYRLRQSHETFYCPKGHSRWFPSKSDTEKLQDQLQQAARDREYLEAKLGSQRERAEAAERSRNAYKGQTTRLKNRAAAGMCPCCNRHFTALEQHIATKHPDYAKDQSE